MLLERRTQPQLVQVRRQRGEIREHIPDVEESFECAAYPIVRVEQRNELVAVPGTPCAEVPDPVTADMSHLPRPDLICAVEVIPRRLALFTRLRKS